MAFKHMKHMFLACALALAGFVLHVAPAYAAPLNENIAYNAWLAIHETEKANGIPRGLLHAMSLVETGMGMDGHLLPWPYTVNVNRSSTYDFTSSEKAMGEVDALADMGYRKFDVYVDGIGHHGLSVRSADSVLKRGGIAMSVRGRSFSTRYPTKTDALRALNKLVAAGITNFDVGLMQINWYWHHKAFTGGLAQALDPKANLAYAVRYLQTDPTQDWWSKVGFYHSGHAAIANDYVLSVWDMYRRVHGLTPEPTRLASND